VLLLAIFKLLLFYGFCALHETWDDKLTTLKNFKICVIPAQLVQRCNLF
jgi:hypothetical protein